MYSVGIDVGLNRSSVDILDCNGKRFKRFEVKGPWSTLIDRMAEVPKPFAVCFEASCGYGYLYEGFSRYAQQVKVAHPGKLRVIFQSKRKYNRVDAEKLAKILYLDEVPQVHVAPEQVRAWRQTIEFRQRILAQRVRVKNRIRALLHEQGIVPPRSLWTKKSLAWLGQLEMNEASALRRDLLVGELDESSQKIKRVEKYLKKVSDRQPAVWLLKSIPGIGPRTAEALVAYIDDVRRFARIKQLGCYFGLVPCQDATGDKNRLGHITREGPATVRKLLCEAAWVAIRKSPTVRAFFERVRHDDPKRKKIALVATAHYLLRCAAAMLRSGEPWQEQYGRQLHVVHEQHEPEQHEPEQHEPEQPGASIEGGGENPSGPKGSPLPPAASPDDQRVASPPPLSASPIFPQGKGRRRRAKEKRPSGGGEVDRQNISQ